MKFLKVLAALALAACAFILSGGWINSLPRGTYIDGVYVGGMTHPAAVSAVRSSKISSLKQKELVICAGEHVYTFTYPEFNFIDKLQSVVRSVRRAGEYSSHTVVYLNGAEAVARAICSRVGRAPAEPSAIFNAEGAPFTYSEGREGILCDSRALLRDISRSINGSFERVTLRTRPVPFGGSMEEVRRVTARLASFATLFDSSNRPRSFNIALACGKINGISILPGETFSFNDTVGPRTAENGFKTAKIISGGKFVEGVGGGVCQVSTTLYNAALLAGMRVTESHPHSLQVSYVKPGADAMVNYYFADLRFVNDTKNPVYLETSANGSSLTVRFYGEPMREKYVFESDIVGRTEPKEVVEKDTAGEYPDLKKGERKIVRAGRAGLTCESRLLRYSESGKFLGKCKLRRDKYQPIDTIIVEGTAEWEIAPPETETEETPAEGGAA